MTDGGKNTRRGSALIMVLFVIVVLSMIVGSFGFEANLEAMYVRYVRDRMQCEYLAKSGFAIAEMLMTRRSPGASVSEDDDRWAEAAERLARGQPVNGLVEPCGTGYIILDIAPEPGRVNVNLMTHDDWEVLLENIGMPEEYRDQIIDPIIDWIDADENTSSKGAETEDYYSRLDPPYKAKNGPVDTVRELLLVKGFSETLLSGGLFDPATLRDKTEPENRFTDKEPRPADTNQTVISGMENMLTTYGDGKINIQSAPYDVLRTLPDVDDILARAIMEERETYDNDTPNPFTSVGDVFARIDGLNREIEDKITVSSKYFRITSTGRVGNVERRIWCIAYLNNGKIRYLRWCEEP